MATSISPQGLNRHPIILRDPNREPFGSRWQRLCTVAGVCGCWGWGDGDLTWDSSGLCGRSEGEHTGFGLALLVLRYHIDLVLCIPVQAAQHHIIAAVREADLRFPVRNMLLKAGRRGKKLQNRATVQDFGDSTGARGMSDPISQAVEDKDVQHSLCSLQNTAS